jgi:protein TonB
MASMSGVALPSGHPSPPERGSAPEDSLFTDLVVSNPAPPRRRVALPVSLAVHVVVIASVVLIPIFWPEQLPDHKDYIRALLYNPPPPPPPPLPKGSALVEKPQTAKPVTPDPHPIKPELTVQIPKEDKPITPEPRAPEQEQSGSPTGSEVGMAEGMDGGVEGGVVGGVLGGVIGGCVGCTGDGPVLDYDQAPKLLKQVDPHPYPQEAFVKKIEGVVLVQILIDGNGNVAEAHVLRSIPALDQAAINAVKQWKFAPAMKGGRPVATIAQATVAFRIY